ncbi:MAG TPA: DCC1-like thiol-disulfide oxidoreductase family protein [Gemmatimonadales bacterium]|nr:DCC1-like thiol-disulfide oxidoreductase family protein [Gemmatimonadales bacterium]
MADDRADLLFYDGTCGLCHRLVTFVVGRDRQGTRFRFAPLAGDTFADTFQGTGRGLDLPDSVVIRTADGRTLVRSAAILHIGERLGGPWRATARLLGLLPRWLLDLGYDGVARVRRALFARPAESCPFLPPELRSRFLP